MEKFSIIDAHLHLIDAQILNYPWLNTLPMLNAPHGLGQLHAATAANDIAAFIFVQTECLPQEAFAEVEWVTKQAAEDKRIAGIIARAELEKGLLIFSELETLKQNTLVKGVRRLIQSEADPFFCMQPDFLEGVKLLSQFDFTFDICIQAHQIPQAIYLATECPDVQFILDHCGKPKIADNQLQPWQDYLSVLARLPNVACKLSGLLAEAKQDSWQVSDLQPFVDYAIQCFGVERILFGSDWPVVNLNGSYAQWLEVVFELLKNCSPADKKTMLELNAKRIYKLEFSDSISSSVSKKTERVT